MEKITRENCEKLNRFEHITAKNADGTRLRARRNGKTQTWGRKPESFTIPVKHGLHNHGYINNKTSELWEGEE